MNTNFLDVCALGSVALTIFASDLSYSPTTNTMHQSSIVVEQKLQQFLAPRHCAPLTNHGEFRSGSSSPLHLVPRFQRTGESEPVSPRGKSLTLGDSVDESPTPVSRAIGLRQTESAGRADYANPIKQSSGQAAQSQEIPPILFDEPIDLNGLEVLAQLGAKQYWLLYQNECDPSAESKRTIDAAAVARKFADMTKGLPTPVGWGVLDFETPFDEDLQKGASTPENIRATKSLIETIQVMKRAFPGIKWTYYGMPGCAFYLNGHAWADASPEDRKAEIVRQINAYKAVLSECEWLAPCIYDTIGDGKEGVRGTPALRRSVRLWHSDRVRMCVDFAKTLDGPRRPVIPFASPLYMPGGGGRAWSPIPSDIMLEDTIQPAFAAGAAGLCIWTNGTWVIRIATGEIPNSSFSEGGGRAGLIKRWASDLGLTEEQIAQPASQSLLKSHLSGAIATFAKLANVARKEAVTPKPPLPDS